VLLQHFYNNIREMDGRNTITFLTDRQVLCRRVNNKIKVIKRRCYGILNVKHLFQRIYSGSVRICLICLENQVLGTPEITREPS